MDVCMFFSFERFFKINQGVPQPPFILSHFYVEQLVTWHPLTNDFFGKLIEKINYLGYGSPQLIS